jgi:uncharacterized RDD family membrane protein YckC
VALDDQLKIDTPEQVALELPIAGVGSRCVAMTVDTLLQGVAIIAFLLIMFMMQRGPVAVAGVITVVGPIAVIVLSSIAYWSYFALFEFFWSGRTPGKRLAGIRVIKESGRPITAYEAAARNVLRAVDFLPVAYGVGIVVMVANRHSRRLGDFVAGTVVVYETQFADVRPTWTTGDGGSVRAGFSQVTAQELALVERYLERRIDLAPLVREERGEQIMRHIVGKTGVEREPAQSVDEYLEMVARQVRDTARYR